MSIFSESSWLQTENIEGAWISYDEFYYLEKWHVYLLQTVLVSKLVTHAEGIGCNCYWFEDFISEIL